MEPCPPHRASPFPAALAAGLFAAAMVPPAVAAAAAPTDTRALIESLRREYELPALAVVVVNEGEVVERIATGVRKHGSRALVTTNDLFHIGSCTKAMTATLAALFIEEGKLRWDSSIVSVFPELKGRINPQYESVTVEQLMTHRGGCPNAPPADAWAAAWRRTGTPTRQRYDFINAVLAATPEAAPGTRFIYSNQGYAILGAMLEKLSGQPWETLLRDRLFRPLGMSTAGFGVPGTLGQVDQPWGHTRTLLLTTPVQKDNPPAIGPGGTVHCSLDDLARFVMLHLRRGAGPIPLLKPETFARLHTPPAGGEYAGGWLSVDREWARGKALTHNGSNTFWYVVLWLAPERNFAVIAATNIAGEKAEKACDTAASKMIERWIAH